MRLTGIISGLGRLTKTGAATLVLSGVNTYSGTTTITTGTLKAGSFTALSPGSAFVVNGILDLNGFDNTVGSLAGSGTVTNASQAATIFRVGNDNTSTKFSGTITDGTSSLALTKLGTGRLTLTGANTYTGGTTIVGGTLQLGNVLQPSSQYAFGVWANGFGDFVNLDSDFNSRGYRFTTGGFDVGVDYRFLDHFAIGVVGNYSHTWTDLRPGTISVNRGRGGLYATYFNGGYCLNGGIYGGYNTYDTSRQALAGNATGNTAGAEWSTFVSTGYDFHYGNLAIGPIASLQYTNVYVTGFSETGSVAPLRIHSDSEESFRSDLGFKASYPWQIGAVLVAPYLKAAWEHEFKYSALPVTAGLSDIPGPTATFVGPAEGHDSVVLSTGFAVHWTPRVSTYAEYDGQLGRARYDSNAVTGGVQVSW